MIPTNPTMRMLFYAVVAYVIYMLYKKLTPTPVAV